MMNLLKAYVDEDVYDPPLEDADIPYAFDFPNDNHTSSSHHNESMEQQPRPRATPLPMFRFPPYLPGRRLFWVEQVEAFFHIAGIDTDEERFDYVVLHADSRFIAPYLDKVLQWPKKSQPRAWKDLKVYLTQYLPFEQLGDVQRTHRKSDTPKMSDTPTKMSDTPTKNVTPKKSGTPKKSDFSNESDTPKKSGTSAKGKRY